MEIFNHDSSFVAIKSDNLPTEKVGALITKNFISLTIVEEAGKMLTGSLVLKDQDGVYSKIFRMGVQLDLSWGYQNFDRGFRSAFNLRNDFDELTGATERRGVKVICQNISGGGGQDGQVTLNANFLGQESIQPTVKAVYESGTREKVVRDVFTRMGITTTVIDFETSSEKVTDSVPVVQDAKDYKFLNDLADEWQAEMGIVVGEKGPSGYFVSSDKLDSMQMDAIKQNASGASGRQRTLYYNSGDLSNVKSYRWQNHAGDSGQGDGGSFVIIDGKPVYQRFVIENEKAIAYRLNNERIKEALKKQEGFSSKADLTKEIINSTDFDQVKRFFDPVEVSTAPQGLGYTIDVEMIGDPMLTIPLTAVFSKGFPVFLSQAGSPSATISFHFKKITHKISRSGYDCSCQIVDNLNVVAATADRSGEVR